VGMGAAGQDGALLFPEDRKKPRKYFPLSFSIAPSLPVE
jgi:hypothetical protein